MSDSVGVNEHLRQEAFHCFPKLKAHFHIHATMQISRKKKAPRSDHIDQLLTPPLNRHATAQCARDHFPFDMIKPSDPNTKRLYPAWLEWPAVAQEGSTPAVEATLAVQ